MSSRPKGMPKTVWRARFLPGYVAEEHLRFAASYIKSSADGAVSVHTGEATSTTIGAVMAPGEVYTDLVAAQREVIAAIAAINRYAAETLTQGAYEELLDRW